MYHPVYPIHRRPLVVRTGVDYRFTAMVVDQVDAVDGRYEVLFLGTGEADEEHPWFQLLLQEKENKKCFVSHF